MVDENVTFGRIIRGENGLFIAQVLDRSGKVLAEQEHIEFRWEAKKIVDKLETDVICLRDSGR